ncbi:MAG: hypothetical protein LUG93_06455 [Lachnospiraceae bacterium]|nr:hypothetical protein [Lachnospiraceae bacterium]
MDKVIFTKYSDERDPRFSIRTDILEENGSRQIRKIPLTDGAKAHVADIYHRYEALRLDLEHSPLRVNPCTVCGDGVRFPFCEGATLEARLDGLLEKGDTETLVREIEDFFAVFAKTAEPGCDRLFQETSDFSEVFGHLDLPEPLYCREVSDIDMVFANVIETETGPELIDYEWTFLFPVPVKFIQYRCLHYYILGTSRRESLKELDLYGRFGISPKEQEEFEKMERHFQQYILGDYTPLWKLYDGISEGVMELSQMVTSEKEKKDHRTVEIYFDKGNGYSAADCEKRSVSHDGPVTVEITPPEGTRAVRVDPCSGKSVVRVFELRQGENPLSWTSNGLRAVNGDLIFDTEDPQIYMQIHSAAPVTVRFLAEPISGLTRELLLNQYGHLHWLAKTPLWNLYTWAKRLKKDRKP